MLIFIRNSQNGCAIYYCRTYLRIPCWGPVVTALERMGTRVDSNSSGGQRWGLGLAGQTSLSLTPWGHQPVEGTEPIGARLPIVIHLQMPSDIVPRPREGQVKYSCAIIEQMLGDGVSEILVLSEGDFKPHSALVVLDFLVQQDLLALTMVKGYDQDLVSWGTDLNPMFSPPHTPTELVPTMYQTLNATTATHLILTRLLVYLYLCPMSV